MNALREFFQTPVPLSFVILYLLLVLHIGISLGAISEMRKKR